MDELVDVVELVDDELVDDESLLEVDDFSEEVEDVAGSLEVVVARESLR